MQTVMTISLARPLLSRLRRRLAEERGISLIELMIAASLTTVVLGAVLSLGETTSKLAPDDDERANVMDQARTGMYTITRELRQARAVTSVTAYSVQAQVGSASVTYTCNVAHPKVAGRSICTRESDGRTTTVVDHVLNQAQGTPVFARSGNYISVTLKVAAAGDRIDGHKSTLTLSDGLYLRNVP